MVRLRNPRLSTILKYKNENVVSRFSKDFGLSINVSRKLFEDCLIFLWLSNRHQYLVKTNTKSKFPLRDFGLHPDMYIVDEIWHTFLLFSKDYTHFSEKYFGRYLHHQPTLVDLKKAPTKKVTEDQIAIGKQAMQNFMNFIYNEVGEKVYCRWFTYLPRRYPKKSA